MSDRSEWRSAKLTNRRKLTLKVLQKKGTDQTHIARDCFSHVKARELKHSSLVKTPKGRNMVVDFIRHLKKSNSATYVVHKEFCLLTKLVDLWVEPAMRALDFDFYEGGANISFSNMSFLCLQSFESKRFLTKHLRRFQKMTRERTWRRYRDFWGGIHKDFADRRKESVKILEFFTNAESILGPDHLAKMDDRPLDVTLTCALEIAAQWSDRATGTVELVHDTSSAMARAKWLWDAIVSPSVPTATVGFAHRKRKYPLAVTSTVFQNSRDILQLQLVDLLAGATAEWARGKLRRSQHKNYCAELEKAGLIEIIVGALWPARDVERAESLPGEQPIDPFQFFGDIVSSALLRRPSS